MSKNVLLITADDLFSVTAHRTTFGIEIKTPNIDRIAVRGCRFDHAYAPIAVCGPSRASTFTGLSPFHIGLLDNDADWKHYLRPEHAWQYNIRKGGHWTATQGKIFHGYGAQPQVVYDALYDNLPFPISNKDQTPKSGEKVRNGGLSGGVGWVGHDDEFYDARVTEMAVESIAKAPKDRPFYIEVGYHHPHTPFNNPQRFFDEINVDDIMMPQEWGAGWDLLPFPDVFQSTDTDWLDPANWTDEQIDIWRKTVRNYVASIHFLDECLGRVLDALDESGRADETIIVFMSDHGYHLADRGRWKKFTAYEQAALAPFIISDPDAEPRVVTDPVSLTDLGPTLLDMLGLPPASGHVGRSLKPVIEGETVAPRPVPTFWYGSASVRIENRRMILWQDGSTEMFDVVKDPWQQHRITDDPNFAYDRDALIHECHRWGLKFVEQGLDLSGVTPFRSFLGEQLDDVDVAGGMVSIGELTEKGRPPGFHEIWGITNTDDDEIQIPMHVRKFGTAAREASIEKHMVLRGNKHDNVIVAKMMRWDSLTIHAGEGDDKIHLDRTATTVYAGHGNDLIYGSAEGDVIHGGAGDDVVHGGSGDDYIEGGSGRDKLYGGRGRDTIVATAGTNLIDGGPGDDTIIIKGGKNEITTGGDRDLIIFHRTGRPQRVTDFNGRQTIDVSDWAPLGEILLQKRGNATVMSCHREEVVFDGTKPKDLAPALKGASAVKVKN